jgi:subtilisin family serine protease
LAVAILDCIQAGARLINLSLALAQPSMRDERVLGAALDHATRQGVVIVAAAGNQNALGSTAITRHPWVIPVVAYDRQGKPLAYSNFGSSIGRRGLGAPGNDVDSLVSDGQAPPSSGTSVATPFITGTIALLWSMFPKASAQHVKLAATQAATRRTSVVPPLLDAWAAYQTLAVTNSR